MVEENLSESFDEFKNLFGDEISEINAIVKYEVLILEIQQALDEISDNKLLRIKIKELLENFNK